MPHHLRRSPFNWFEPLALGVGLALCDLVLGAEIKIYEQREMEDSPVGSVVLAEMCIGFIYATIGGECARLTRVERLILGLLASAQFAGLALMASLGLHQTLLAFFFAVVLYSWFLKRL